MVKLELWNTLQELKEEEFQKFKWFLQQNNIVRGFSGIPVRKLEHAEIENAIDVMVQTYHNEGALEVTLKILENIGRNDLVLSLQIAVSEPKDLLSHDYMSLEAEFGTKKNEIEEAKSKMKIMIQERQTKIFEIQNSVERSVKSADTHISDCERAFAILQEYVAKTLTSIVTAIEEKRQTTKRQAEGFIRELETEISDLSKRSKELEQVANIENKIEFLKSLANLSPAPPSAKEWTDVKIEPPSYGLSVGISVNELEEKIKKEKERLIARAKVNRVRQFAKDVTLDPETAFPNLVLSDDRKQVYCGENSANSLKISEKEKPAKNLEKRFDTAVNVLGKQGCSTGRFYFEVEVRGKTSWTLGFVKKSITRKGSITLSVKNGYWTIGLKDGDKYVTSGDCLNLKWPPEKVGVFADFEKGSVSFFDADSAEIIHSFAECDFKETLLPFFSPGLHHGGKNCTPLIISPID